MPGTGPQSGTTDHAARLHARQGIVYAIASFLLWGLTPIFYKALAHVTPAEILAHRAVWSVVILLTVLALQRRVGAIGAALAVPRTRWTLMASTLLIAVNWFVFIYAIQTARVAEASLGYYINPLVSALLGVVVLHERLRGLQIVSVGLAVAGVAVLTIGQGLPWIAVTLAISFGLYGLLRKTARVDAVAGLAVETSILAPLGLGYLVWLVVAGDAPPAALGSASLGTHVLLIMAGGVTVIPLVLFTAGAQRLRLTTLGLLQYLAPSCQLLLAVWLYGEPFGAARAVSFALIWAGLLLYSLNALRR